MALQGLTVASDGSASLLRSGVRFRNIGLNYGGAIVRISGQTSPLTCEYTPGAEQDAAIALFQSLGVKIVRVKLFPYWPANFTVGVNAGLAWNVATAADREAYYLKIDAFVAKCRAANIGIIFNFFFRIATVPDLVGGTNRAWLSAGNTRTFATTLTQEIVTRYLAEQAVYGWEMSNEVNHYLDASDATKGTWPGANTAYGTPASYTAASTCFNGSEWAAVVAWWYGVVRVIDSQRIVLSGNGPSSYSQSGGTAGIANPVRAWHAEQARDNPTNCGSIHFYGGLGYSSQNYRGLESLLIGAKHWMRNAGAGLVLGEFGNQARKPTTMSKSGSTVAITLLAGSLQFHSEPGDSVVVAYAGGGWDGTYTLDIVAADGMSATATAPGAPTTPYSGSAARLNHLHSRFARMLDDIIASNVDVALIWGYDADPYFNPLESISDTNNAWMLPIIAAANARLG